MAESPKLIDPDLKLTLFAEDPDIVTPIGMAIDGNDRVFVIESHTHHPPDDYNGPDSDRIKIFEDTDGDGKADQISIFADGIEQAMNLAFSPDGNLYVVCAREVLCLIDNDRDGKCDEQKQVLKLVTKQRYAHNCLLSISFDREGWMYVSRGNVASDLHRLVGQDKSFVEGFGDGGNVVRCRPDGTNLTELATGFWNPFDIKFDRTGQLLLVDNDPDARGPNRLLKVVPGGDYGYKSLFGGSGTHPFQGWDGSLPGTLPYLSGTGEAPSGLIDCRRSALPQSYRHSVLATIWNENSIERFEIDPASGKAANKSVFMQGDQDFRPVAMDCDTQGNLFVTDWVLVDYPNHGMGKIWRISTKQGINSLVPQAYFDPYIKSQPNETLNAIDECGAEKLIAMLSEKTPLEPMAFHAVVMRLASSEMAGVRQQLFHAGPQGRMAALLASQRAQKQSPQLIQRFLRDPEPQIRRAALMWAGQSHDVSLADQLAVALTISPVTPRVFEMYLAAVEVLDPTFVDAFQNRTPDRANKLPMHLNPQVIVDVAKNESLPDNVRSLAIKRFDLETIKGQLTLLKALLDGTSEPLVSACIEVLASPEIGAEFASTFLAIANDSSRSATVRTEAIAALEDTKGFDRSQLESLLNDSNVQVATQAKRTWAALGNTPIDRTQHPTSTQQWHEALQEPGDPLLGRHLFYSVRVGCSKCHNMNGRGGTLGPDLGGIASSRSRKQIIDAILDPSADFAPQYQAWMVLTVDGDIIQGLQLDHKAKGAIVLTTQEYGDRYFKADEIEAYRALPTSLMPTGMEQLMTVEEFRDLVAYLNSL